jgi:hypothetical protein
MSVADTTAARLALLTEAEIAALNAPDDDAADETQEFDTASSEPPEDQPAPAPAQAADVPVPQSVPQPVPPAPAAQSPLPPADPAAVQALAAAKEALAAEKAALRQRWNSGEIDTDEYEAGRDALDEKRAAILVEETALKISAQAQQQTVQNTWLDAQRRFAAANPSLDLTKPAVYAAFGAVLAEVNADPASAALSDDAVLAEAHKRYLAAFGLPAPQQGSKAAPSRDSAPRDVVPTLAAAPAAALVDTSNGEWAVLDRMAEAAGRSTEAANAYEDALRRLPRDRREAYLAQAG